MPPKKKPEEVKKVRFGRVSNTLKMGLVGLPNVGKSTTFNLLTKCNVPAENFPFCTIEPHEAVVPVPDDRFSWLCEAFKPKSEVQAVLKIWDIAGLVRGAHAGEGLGNSFLSNIGAVDGIYHMCRAFDGEEDNITHTEGEVDPVRDLEIIHGELIMKDLERLNKLVEDYDRKWKQNNKLKEVKDELDALVKAKALLDEGVFLCHHNDWSPKEIEWINKYQFLTTKPGVYLVNLSQKDYIRQKNKFLAKINDWVQAHGGGPIIPFSAEFENNYNEKETDADKAAFLAEVGAKKSMLERIIKTGYETLDLIHFMTCGPDEVRCWTVHKQAKAPQAAGVIHTDMERGFICMEVYKFADIKEHLTESEVKANGKYMQKGKEYEVLDGDIVFIKFNVTTSSKK